MDKRYCEHCLKATEHVELKPLSFLEQCAIAMFSKFSCDLREHRFECVECGSKRD